MITMEKMRTMIESKLYREEKALAEVAKQLVDPKEHPGEAIKWANLPKLVANVSVLRIVWNAICEDASQPSRATPESVYEFATKEALRHAQYPSETTCAVERLTHQYTGAAWASLVDEMRYR